MPISCKADGVTDTRSPPDFAQRASSTVHVMRRMNWTWDDRSGSSVRMVNDECLRLKGLDRTKFAPFRGPLDRFRWTTTAGYFMCWYSMQVNARFSGDYGSREPIAVDRR